MLDDLAKRLRAGGHIPSNTGDACDRENWPTVHLAPTLYARLMERCRRFAATGAIDAHGLVTVLVNSAAQVPADPTNNDLDWNTELEYFDQILREVRGQQNARRRIPSDRKLITQADSMLRLSRSRLAATECELQASGSSKRGKAQR